MHRSLSPPFSFRRTAFLSQLFDWEGKESICSKNPLRSNKKLILSSFITHRLHHTQRRPPPHHSVTNASDDNPTVFTLKSTSIHLNIKSKLVPLKPLGGALHPRHHPHPFPPPPPPSKHDQTTTKKLEPIFPLALTTPPGNNQIAYLLSCPCPSSSSSFPHPNHPPPFLPSHLNR